MTNGQEDQLLSNLVEERMKGIRRMALDISLNELVDMYRESELNIRPEYQRLFRWSEGTQSRFVESLLLELPVPPIYVIEEDENRYSLIDGLQRISSYLHLRGELAAPYLDPPIHPGDFLELTDCDIIPELNGKRYVDLETSLQIRLKRSFLRVEVVRQGCNPQLKYHMFKRLNTGGVLLTEQQVRNCTIRLLNPRFNDFIIGLSRYPTYKTCITNLSQEAMLGAQDQELVLRFFALRNFRSSFKHDIGDFLTEYMEAVSEPGGVQSFDYVGERRVFDKTFASWQRHLMSTHLRE